MKIHERTLKVQKASADIGTALDKIAHEYELTSAEFLSILGEQIQHTTKYMIREERHGNPDTPGDLAE